jgi:hypothetical protein
MTRPLSFLFLLTCGLHAAVVIDRIAVVVGNHAVKLSDIERDLRVTEFLNREPLNLSPDARRKAAERQIDQQIIRQEIATGGYQRASDTEAQTMLRQLERDRFGGSAARLKQALQQYGLTEDELRQQLVWQLTVLRFIDQRFRPGVLVTDDEIQAYKKQHPQMADEQIRETLEGERINQEFETWLDGARKRMTRIEYRDEAFK